MNDVRLRPLVTHNLLEQYQGARPQGARESGFGSLLRQSLDKVSSAQRQADLGVQRVISGQETDLHRVMIAQEEASLSFELMLEVRNKLLEAYQQLMQMQV